MRNSQIGIMGSQDPSAQWESHRGGSRTVNLNGVILSSRYLQYLETFLVVRSREGMVAACGWRPGVLGNIPQQLS